MDVLDFFQSPKNILHKQYEALRSFYVDKMPVEDIAKKFGYTTASVYSLIRDLKQLVQKDANKLENKFFKLPDMGRKPSSEINKLREQIISLRKKYLSVPEIKAILTFQNESISEKQIYNILSEEGFERLPRRDKSEKANVNTSSILSAAKSTLITLNTESFPSVDAGLLVFWPYISNFGLDKVITDSSYPDTIQMPKINSILAFLALKLSGSRRYCADDLWCMDRGSGLFAGLNVLPKTAWFSSYSSRVTRDMNISFLKSLATTWAKHNLLSDTINMDFVTVPYWGDEDHLENNWSGTRHHALESILAALAHDPDSGIITYGDTTVRHENESNTAIEFLDFYKSTPNDLKYLIFDSKFTTYKNLKKIDENNIKFITIRRRGQKILEDLESVDKKLWKKVKVPMSNGKNRFLNVYEEKVKIKDYGKELRQIAITGHGKIKPALIITNDFDLSQGDIIRKYSRRWLVEKTISEQTHFFHLNKLSSSMVIKVDFDLTMTILAYNLYRLLAQDLPGFENGTAQTLYEKFIHNSGTISFNDEQLLIKLKKKRTLPALLEAMNLYKSCKLSWFKNREIKFEGASMS